MPSTARRSPKKNLIYTVIFDAPGSESYRFLGRMLASSLLRTFFSGDILIFRNSAAPLFLVERKGLEEVYLETPEMFGQKRAEFAWCWKYKVAELIDADQYDKILFVDADCLALRNLDHLLEGDWDIRYQPERGKPMSGKSFNAFLTEAEMSAAGARPGVNSGTLAVRGAVFHEVMAEWQRIDEGEPLRDSGFRDQASWNALLLRSRRAEVGECGGAEVAGVEDSDLAAPSALPWRAEPFPPGEVMFPGYLDPQFSDYRNAALTHNILPDTEQKIEFTFGLYMRTFFCDPSGLFFSMLEM